MYKESNNSSDKREINEYISQKCSQCLNTIVVLDHNSLRTTRSIRKLTNVPIDIVNYNPKTVKKMKRYAKCNKIRNVRIINKDVANYNTYRDISGMFLDYTKTRLSEQDKKMITRLMRRMHYGAFISFTFTSRDRNGESVDVRCAKLDEFMLKHLCTRDTLHRYKGNSSAMFFVSYTKK